MTVHPYVSDEIIALCNYHGKYGIKKGDILGPASQFLCNVYPDEISKKMLWFDFKEWVHNKCVELDL